MKVPNIVRMILGGVAAAGTFLVTQTTLSVTVKDGIYVGLVFISAILLPTVTPALPPPPRQAQVDPYQTPPSPPKA